VQTQETPPRISVICTVLNEGESIRRLMDSLVAQTRVPDEVVIVDGGSRDNTVEVIQEYANRLPLLVLEAPGANISRGRNAAVEAATGSVIASTDAGVWLEPAWLASLLTPFLCDSQSGGCPQVCSGFFVPDPQSLIERAMGATVLPAVEEVDPETFLPSSRSVAFTKQVWAAAGGYPEWLDYCEDLIFDIRLRELAGRFAWAPDALAHFRPRGSLRTFFKQYYRYARGDGKADLWRKRHAIRYGTYLLALPVIFLLSALSSPLWLLALPVSILAYCATPYRRLRAFLPGLSPSGRILAALLVPIIRATGDVAKMLGYPAGWAWRLRNWHMAEIHRQ
jgi:glycosyltransferase involved in cell wall biosynthesis